MKGIDGSSERFSMFLCSLTYLLNSSNKTPGLGSEILWYLPSKAAKLDMMKLRDTKMHHIRRYGGGQTGCIVTRISLKPGFLSLGGDLKLALP